MLERQSGKSANGIAKFTHLLERRQLQQISVFGGGDLEGRSWLRRVYVALAGIRRAPTEFDRADARRMRRRRARMTRKRRTWLAALQTGRGRDRGGGMQRRMQRRQIGHGSTAIPG